MNKIKAGIIGAAGYTGGEMIRILLNHADVNLHFIQSSSSAGKYLYEVHADLLGETDRKFEAEPLDGADVVFLCVGHGDARNYLNRQKFDSRVKIVDLSQDFRLKPGEFESSAGTRKFVYGLPELNREAIRNAENIANPGCFATAIQLALLPLASRGLLLSEVHISAVTGSTGAGQSLADTTHFTWRENNLSVYKAFTHQHLNEINMNLGQLQPGFSKPLNFIPYRGDFTRGIIASVYTDCTLSYDEAFSLYSAYYKDHPFTWVSAKPVDLKQVINTNKVFLSLQIQEGKLLIVSVLDNLIKGASGQAVQNMNLLFGLDESAGLKLKAVAF